MSTVITQERRGSEDRRIMIATPLFPFFDSEDTLVRQDRRQIPERRINNITIEDTVTEKASNSNIEEALGNKRLFIWFQDEIHEIKRTNDNVWIGRSSDCLATFESRFVSRKHARLYFEDGAYYLLDNSINGTYIKNDDGETFITKGKVVVKGSGVISLGVPLDHSESDLIHFFIG
ncbi:MAG: FHA domain-containing protein [Gammaproteobacteria bacterium]